MQIAGYTLLKNHEDYLEFVEDMKECYDEEFNGFYFKEPKQYPILVNFSIGGGTLCDIYDVEKIEYHDLKELYNYLQTIFDKEN